MENAKNPADKQEPKVTLPETIVPTDAIDNAPSARPNPVALATTAGLADPVVKAAFAKALQKQVEENNQQLAKNPALILRHNTLRQTLERIFPKRTRMMMADTRLRLASRMNHTTTG